MKLAKGIALAAALAAATISVTGHADEQVPADRTITDITVYGDLAVIGISPVITNADGCPGSASTRKVTLDWTTNPVLKNMYAVALLASATGQKVGFGLRGCRFDLPNVYRMSLAQ